MTRFVKMNCPPSYESKDISPKNEYKNVQRTIKNMLAQAKYQKSLEYAIKNKRMEFDLCWLFTPDHEACPGVWFIDLKGKGI